MSSRVSYAAHRRGGGPKGNGVRQAHDASSHPLDYVFDHTAVQRHPRGPAARDNPVLRPVDSHQPGHVQGHTEDSSGVSALVEWTGFMRRGKSHSHLLLTIHYKLFSKDLN